MTQAPRMIRSMPILQVRDVAVSVAHFARLGFACNGMWDDPPSFAIVQRGDVTLGLDRSGDGAIPANQWWAAYLYVDDVDAVHAELDAAGLADTAPEDRVYGCRDFDVIDADGHRLAIGQDMAADRFGPGLGPDRGRG